MFFQGGEREFSIGQLLAFGGAAALLPSVLLGAYALFDLVSRDHEAQRQRLEQTARAIVVAVDRELDEVKNTAALLAGSRLARSGNLMAYRELLRDASEVTRYEFHLIDRASAQYIDIGAEANSTIATPTLAKYALNAFNGPAKSSTKLTTEGETGSSPVVLAPITAGNKVPYVLAISPRPEDFERVLNEVPLPKGWIAAIDDPNNLIIARSQQPEKFVGTKARLRTPQGGSGVVEFADLEGRPSITAYAVSPRTNFRAVVWAPEDVFFASTDMLQNWLIGLAGMAVLLTVGAAYSMGTLLSAPVRQIAVTARALGSGQNVVHRRTVMKEANLAEAAMEQAAETIATRQLELLRETEKSRLLTRELAHRVKNLLAVVSAIARQTMRPGQTPEDFADRFQTRLAGLARSVDLLVNNDWTGARLKDLISRQLEPFGADRFSISGPDLMLTSAATEHLGLALHELATNAAKHGSLSGCSGRLDIDWGLAESDFVITWQETGGPPIEQLGRRGFGRTVTEAIVGQALNGTATLEYSTQGLKWTLRAPKGLVVDLDPVAFTARDAAGDDASPARPRREARQTGSKGWV